MASFSEYPIAAAMRDAIMTICEGVVERLRPPPRYAEVVSLTGSTPDNCYVRFINETDKQLVALASVRPSRAGQLVRIEGTVGDRYVADVLGEAVITGGGIPLGSGIEWYGTEPPHGFLQANGQLLTVDQYPELFVILQYRFGGSGNTFALPTRMTATSGVMVVIRVL